MLSPGHEDLEGTRRGRDVLGRYVGCGAVWYWGRGTCAEIDNWVLGHDRRVLGQLLGTPVELFYRISPPGGTGWCGPGP